MPMFFATFLDVTDTCSLKVKCSSTYTHTSFVEVTWIISLLSIFIPESRTGRVFLHERNMMLLVLDKFCLLFTDSLLALNQSDRLSNSIFTLLFRVSRDLSDRNTLVSSTKIMNWRMDEEFKIPFMYIKNSSLRYRLCISRIAADLVLSLGAHHSVQLFVPRSCYYTRHRPTAFCCGDNLKTKQDPLLWYRSVQFFL